MSLIDIGEVELNQLLSPQRNLKTLAEAAICQQLKDKIEVSGSGNVTGDVADIGAPVTGVPAGPGEPGLSGVVDGPFSRTGACGSSELAGGRMREPMSCKEWGNIMLLSDRSSDVKEVGHSDKSCESFGLAGVGGPFNRTSENERPIKKEEASNPMAEVIPEGWCQGRDRERRNGKEDLTSAGGAAMESAAEMSHGRPGQSTYVGAREFAAFQSAPDQGMLRSNKPVAMGTKLGEFDGSNTAVETFLARFQNCADYLNWNEPDKLYYLKASLAGPAGQILWNLPSDVTSSQIMQLLRNRFGSLHQQERYRAEIRSKRRGPHESLQSLYTDLCRLLSLAYPGQTSPLLDLVARDAFLQSLNDSDLVVRILEKEPISIDQALSIACRIEAYDKCAGRTVKSGPSDADFSNYKPKYVKTALGSTEPTDLTDKVSQQLAAMQQAFDRVCDEMKAQREEQKSQRSEMNFLRRELAARDRATAMQQQPVAGKGQSGEFLPPPPEFTESISDGSKGNFQNTGAGNNRTADNRGRTCWTCGSSAHLSGFHKKKQEDRNSGSPGTQARGIAPSAGMADVYVRLKINNRRVSALLDSGCEFSVCGRRLIPDVQLQPTTQRLYAANGTPIELLGEAEIELNIEGRKVRLNVAVSAQIGELILGVDFMVKRNCVWQFSRSTITIDGQSVRLHSRPPQAMVRRIYAEHDVAIPSGHAMDIPVIITRPDLKQSSPAWATEPKRLSENVLTARTLFTDGATSAAVRAINFSDKQFVVRQGSLMADAEAVSVVKAQNGEGNSASVGEGDVAGGFAGKSSGVTLAGGPAGQPCREQQSLMNDDDRTENVQAGGFAGRTPPSGDLIDFTDIGKAQERSCGLSGNAVEHDSETVHVDELINRLPTELTEEQRIKAATLIRKNAGVFSRSPFDLGRTDLISHQIDTGDHRPIKESLRRHPLALLPEIDAYVQQLWERDLIEPAYGPWSMNLTLVRKSDGSIRYCIDARRLNQVTKSDAYALPRIDTCLESFGNAQWFCTLDAKEAYWMIPISDEASRDRTAFLTRKGLWRWKVMGYGLSQAPATFQRFMDLVLSGLQFEICLAFLDDVIVFGQTFDETCDRLQRVFDRIAYAKIKLRSEKCTLFSNKVRFLGYIVSREGISPDPGKIEAVVNWPVCRNVTEVRAFLALCSYNRKHIFQFAEKARVLYDLTKKGRQFSWGEPEQAAFDNLKHALTTAPVLASPIDDGEYVLDTDASTHSLSAILSQRQNGVLRVIAYQSRVLQDSERSYCSTKLELLALVYGLKKFRNFLFARKFLCRTDNAALTSLMKTPEPLAQQGRWLDLISEFTFEIIHRPAAQNGACDALSRRPCERDDVTKMCSKCRPKSERLADNSAAIINVAQDRCNVLTRSSTANERRGSSETQLAGGPLMSSEAAVKSSTEQTKAQDNVADTRPFVTGGSSGSEVLPLLAGDSDNQNSEAEEITFTSDGQLSRDNLRVEQDRDTIILRIKTLLQQSPVPNNWSVVANDERDVRTLFSQRQTLEVREGILYRQFQKADGTVLFYQAVIPKSLRLKLLNYMHGGLLTGHFGQQKTEKRISEVGYWPGWKTDVSYFVKCCEKCNRYKRSRNVHQGPMQQASVDGIWQKVHVDLCGPFPPSHDNHTYIMTLTCAFSKYLITVPLRSKSSFEVARNLVQHVFLIYSPVELLVHDGGKEFCNTLLRDLENLLDIQSCRITSYRPSANGIAERPHATLHKLLATCVSENQRNWSTCLSYVTFAYNSSYHVSTSFSPFYLMFLRHPNMGIDMVCDESAKDKFGSPEEYALVVRERMQSAYRLVHQHLNAVFDRSKKRYDVRIKECRFEVGKQVWYYCPRNRRNRASKWLLQTSGPYEVVRRINDVNYVVRKSARHTPFTVHIDRIRPYEEPLNENREIPSVRHRSGLTAEQSVKTQSDEGITRPNRPKKLPRWLESYDRRTK